MKYETLVRLRFNEKIYAPYHFLDVARSSGLMNRLTGVVFEKACRKFQDNSYCFSINITEQDLLCNEFQNMLCDTSVKYNIDFTRISLELLESISMMNNHFILERLQRLSKLGFLISVDDFGVEYANFSWLQSFDADSVKIDGTFIKNIHDDDNSKNIVKSILTYTKGSNIETVAEFVHSQEVYETIKKLGVEYAQGYYIGEPQETLKLDTGGVF